MKNYRIAWLSAALATGVLLMIWWTSDTNPAATVDAGAARADDPKKSAPEEPLTGRVAASTSAAPPASDLPSGDMPLPALVALLQPRADAGDGLAACRLGVELLRCDANDYAVSFHQRHQSGFVREKESKGQLALANLVDERHLRQLELQIQCRQLTGHLRSRGSGYLIQAARAGEPEAMLRYAQGEHWGINLDDFLADGRFDAWRRETPGMLQRALEAGDPRVAHVLMGAYYDDLSIHTGLIANEPVRGLAFQMLHFRLTGRPSPKSRLGASEVAQAEALAAEMHLRHFGNRQLDSPEQAFLPSLFSAGSDGRDPRFCRRREE